MNEHMENIARYLVKVLLVILMAIPSLEAQPQCYAFYSGRLFSQVNGEAEYSKSVKMVLDRILGHVRTEKGDRKYNRNVVVNSNIDTNTRRKAGRGDELIQILMAHKDPFSPTAERVEEKAVKVESDFKSFLSFLQSEAFARKYGKGIPGEWSLRDVPKPGRNFLTVTEYGQHFVLKQKSERGDSTFVIKPRFRKYFDYDAQRPQDVGGYNSITRDIVSFELKIASLSGPENGQFLEVPGIVFKPRIFVTDAIADQIKSLSGESANIEKQLFEIRESILKLVDKDGKSLNSLVHVDSMIEAMQWLLQKDPGFFVPQYITAYNRLSLKFGSEGGEYQLTADRNIRVYKADSNIKSSGLVQYISKHSLYGSLPEEVFVELKTPEGEKRKNTPLYQELIARLESDHVAKYKMGSGKYSIARKIEDSMFDVQQVKSFVEQGIQFWLVKGTSNLDAAPREKDILNSGIVQVAFPFKNEEGKTYRAVFEYRPLNNLNGTKDAILGKIEVIDEFGNELDGKKIFKDIIREIQNRGATEVLGLNFSGTVIPLVSRIPHIELVKYQDFLRDYFQNPERKLEELHHIEDSKNLAWQKAKIRAMNFKTWVIERTNRGLFGVSFATAGSFLTLALSGAIPGSVPKELPPSPDSEQNIVKVENAVPKVVYEQSGKAVLPELPKEANNPNKK